MAHPGLIRIKGEAPALRGFPFADKMPLFPDLFSVFVFEGRNSGCAFLSILVYYWIKIGLYPLKKWAGARQARCMGRVRKMIDIAMVEDNEQDARVLTRCLEQYAQKNSLKFQITHFSDALKLINAYRSNYDLIFLDIELPLMSGMEAAKAIRRIDRSVPLVFVTNMAQYAVEGYAVEAFDYILKPINQYAFDLKLKRIISHVGSKIGQRIVIRTAGETIGLQVREICYVESDGHYLNWHTPDRVYRALGTLRSIEQQLPESYCAISRWHVINMQYVRSVVGDDVLLDNEKLHIGRSYKQKFLQAYAEYMVGGM